MALNRINGDENVYVGGIFALRRPSAMLEKAITHILSVIKYDFDGWDEGFRDRYRDKHLSIDIDDFDDSDLLVHLSRTVRFIDNALYEEKGTVFVHCAMGKSRSTAVAIAYLLYKHPHRYGGGGSNSFKPQRRRETADDAVAAALKWVRETRPMAEPNDGFMQQLAVWWAMGCPADSDDAVERHTTYQRWLWDREVKESAALGKAPDWIRFKDEAEAEGRQDDEAAGRTEHGGDRTATRTASDGSVPESAEVRCKKCRRILATQPFIVKHGADADARAGQACPHVFVETLSWMRPFLEEGRLEGRLLCPNTKCAANVGRFSWQGFRCSCSEWVCPAFSLQRGKVDEVVVRHRRTPGGAPGSAAAETEGAAGPRMPPGEGRENL